MRGSVMVCYDQKKFLSEFDVGSVDCENLEASHQTIFKMSFAQRLVNVVRFSQQKL